MLIEQKVTSANQMRCNKNRYKSKNARTHTDTHTHTKNIYAYTHTYHRTSHCGNKTRHLKLFFIVSLTLFWCRTSL